MDVVPVIHIHYIYKSLQCASFSVLTPCGVALSEGVQVRRVNFGRLMHGVLHSKFWIVDRKHVFIGSANMDWRALTQVIKINGD